MAWSRGGGGANALARTFAGAMAIRRPCRSTAEFIGVRCWRFTPTSFRLMLSDLRALGLINRGIRVGFETTGCEFYVSLRKDCPPAMGDRLAELKRIKAEDA